MVMLERQVAYLCVVGMAGAVAVDGRRVDGGGIWAWWRLEMFGGMS